MADIEEVKMVQEALATVEKQISEAIKTQNAEIEKFGKSSTDVTKKLDEMSQKWAELDSKYVEMAQKAQKFDAPKEKAETVGSLFVKSDAFKAVLEGRSERARLEVKNTITGSGGSPFDPIDTIVAPDRLAGIVPGAFRSLNILDFVNVSQTASNQVYYTQEDSWTNDAVEQTEGVEKAESDLTFKLVEEPVRTIAHWLKLSRQVMDDAPALQGYVDRRLTHGLSQRLQSQILKGNGTSPNIAGLSASGRHTAFTPTSNDTGLDSINRAKYLVVGADFQPGVVFLNPADWGAIERSKVSGGGYVLGDGAAITYVQNGMVPVVWGLPVVASNDVGSGKFYVADPNAFELWARQGVTVEMGFIDDDFTKNLMVVRAEMRAALAVYQPTAVRYGNLVL
jgi:HK97 family phage major capsid protein